MPRAVITWAPPTARADAAHTPLSLAEIAFFRVYASRNGFNGDYAIIGQTPTNAATSFTTGPLDPGSYYFRVTAVDTRSQEGDLEDTAESNPVFVVAPVAPPAACSGINAALVEE